MPIEQWKWEYIERNMVEFNRGLHILSKASERFSRYFHWYYHPRLDIFAPSKFIGYSETTHENYDGWGSGGQTQQILRTYFDHVPPEDYEHYLNKLIMVADSYGYTVSKKTLEGHYGWIYVPKRDVLEQYIMSDSAYEILDDEDELHKEGLRKSSVVNKYERNPKIKKAAILYHGVTCMGCKFNFEEFYGDHGKGFIEIHHINPLSSVQKEHYVDPKEDIAVLCANCHRMIHRRRSDMLSLDELIAMVQRNKATRC
ncbi:HNH endonuclease [Paenibacillus sp. FJAT-27812]|uniref:HNH endonuclease n=1 Tax=Paenibacillus sp. FJAT-27812 TaxID=1684143 RepID=UPI0006A7BA86|nr:HNH endonuclease [Paenibacillus sp. FJAT-27812]